MLWLNKCMICGRNKYLMAFVEGQFSKRSKRYCVNKTCIEARRLCREEGRKRDAQVIYQQLINSNKEVWQ